MKLLDSFFDWLEGGMKKPKPDRPGDIGLLLSKVEHVLNLVLDGLAKPQPPIKIEVRCSCCADTQKEILALVKEIKTEVFTQSAAAEAAALAEVKKTLGPTVGRLEEIAKKP